MGMHNNLIFRSLIPISLTYSWRNQEPKKGSDQPKPAQAGKFVLNPTELQPSVFLQCHTGTPPSYLLSIRQCPWRWRPLSNSISVSHPPAWPAPGARRRELDQEAENGLHHGLPSTSRGTLGGWTTASVASRLPVLRCYLLWTLPMATSMRSIPSAWP